jgi:hypothetical protein
MKKYFISAAMSVLLAVGFTACDTETDEKPGGTAIEKMCGYWDVQVDAVDENDNVVYEDIFGSGIFPFYTYNTADNSSTKMWIDDLQQDYFWNMKFLVDVDYAARTFSATNVVYEEGQYEEEEPGMATVWDGKIVENGGLNLHGKPWDTIDFNISFTDDSYPEGYGYDHYHVSGLRHSGYNE